MTRGPIDDVPLDRLFPGLGGPDLARIRAAAVTLDAARPPADAPTWSWSLDPSEASQTAVLCTVVSTGTSTDWTEFDVDVRWSRDSVLEVIATVSVTCCCEVDHNVHYVQEVSLPTSRDDSLPDRLVQGVEQVLAWLAGPLEPSYWRAHAGLPAGEAR